MLLSGAGNAATQVLADPVLEGRVIRGGEPLADETVVLHRVAREQAGSVDSTRSEPDGEFRFELPSVPRDADGPVYFASVRYRGVLYFGSAINRAAQLDSIYRIQVYDTTAAPPEGAAFPVAARNVLLEEVEGRWRAIDLLQIRNDGERTVVGRDDGIVWSYPLPPEADSFEVGQSDLAPDAVTFEGESIRISAPIPPGQRTYLIRYTLPEPTFSIPLPGTTDRFELLIRQPAPQVSVVGAARAEPVEIEPGSNYSRFSASELRNHVIEITEGGGDGGVPLAWLAVGLALVLAVAGIVAVRREPDLEPAEPTGDRPSREEILIRIAELDEAQERLDDPSPARRRRYRKERSRLKSRLQELE